MSEILELRCRVRDYAWGSSSYLRELLGIENPEAGPQAELWMGAHPGAASQVRPDDTWVSLADWIAADPPGRLGAGTAQRCAGELPFLFKVLAAARPLSLQAHPDSEQARAGFERENREGLGLEDPARNYRDARPKPELLCALTTFDALLGFRRVAEIDELMSSLEMPELSSALGRLRAGGEAGLRDFFAWLMGGDERTRARLAQAAAERCRALPEHPARRWVVELADQYPGDIGVLAPLLLNVIRLDAGQAVYLPAGELHSYLGGCGIEVMSSSDNVLRGGLTNKHVDVSELLAVLTFSSGSRHVLEPRETAPGVWTYDTPAADFELARIDVVGEHVRGASASLEILLCTAGEGRVEAADASSGVEVRRGGSLFVPADAGGYRILGDGRYFRVSIPTG